MFPLPAALPVTLLAFLLVSPQMSDRLRRSWPPSFLSEFRALQFSLMLCAFVGALGGAAFLGTAIVIEGDRRQAQLHVQGQSGPPPLALGHGSACLFCHPPAHLWPSPRPWHLTPQLSPHPASGLPGPQADVPPCPQLWGPRRFPLSVPQWLCVCLSSQPWL